MNIQRSILLAAFAITSMGAPAAAQQSCESDADCLKGFVCEKSTLDCATAPCQDGEKCAPVACDPIEYSQCVSGPCTADSDCADGMVCLASTYEECAVYATPACKEGETCAKPKPDECTTRTTSECVPKYEAPCTQDADCGEGFNCIEGQECWCSSSGSKASSGPVTVDAGVSTGEGTGGASGTDPTLPVDTRSDSGCGCKPSGTFYCKMQEIACETDANCPSGWTCVQNQPAKLSCARVSSDGGTIVEDCSDSFPTASPARQCMPPNYSSARDSVGLNSGATTTSDPVSKGGTQSSANDSTDGVESGTANAGKASCSGWNVHSNTNCQVAFGHQGPVGAWAILAGLMGLFGLRRRHAV